MDIWEPRNGQIPLAVTTFAQIGFCEYIPFLEKIGIRGRTTPGMVFGSQWHSEKHREESEAIARGEIKIVTREKARELLKKGIEVSIRRESLRIAVEHGRFLFRGRTDSAKLLPDNKFLISRKINPPQPNFSHSSTGYRCLCMPEVLQSYST